MSDSTENVESAEQPEETQAGDSPAVGVEAKETPKLNLDDVLPVVAEVIAPFFERVLEVEADDVEAIYLLGGAASGEYHGSQTELNSLIVVDQMELDLVGSIGVIGQEFSGSNLRAPVLMTKEYILRSVDVFPLEFLNMKSSYCQIFGDEDVLDQVDIDREDLRLQVERELKGRLVGLRAAFISAAAGEALIPFLANNITSYYPILKGLLHLKGHEIPGTETDILKELHDAFGIPTESLMRVQTIAWGADQTEAEELDPLEIFRGFYDTIRAYSEVADGLGG